jgi:hypothetical protein
VQALQETYIQDDLDNWEAVATLIDIAIEQGDIDPPMELQNDWLTFNRVLRALRYLATVSFLRLGVFPISTQDFGSCRSRSREIRGSLSSQHFELNPVHGAELWSQLCEFVGIVGHSASGQPRTFPAWGRALASPNASPMTQWVNYPGALPV